MRLYTKQSLSSRFSAVAIWKLGLRYRSLIYQLTLRNIQMQHRGSVFGALWAVLNPLLLFAIYIFVFLIVFNGRFGESATESRLDYAFGVFLGLSITQYVIEIMGAAPQAILANPNYVKKVVFPIELLPLSLALAAFFRCLVALVLTLVVICILDHGLPLAAFLLPILILPVFFIGLGLSWFFAALGIFFRDLIQFSAFFGILLTFFSGVFYSVAALPKAFHWLRINPMTLILEGCRDLVLWHSIPSWGAVLYVNAVAIVFVLCCLAFFSTAKVAFSELV